MNMKDHALALNDITSTYISQVIPNHVIMSILGKGVCKPTVYQERGKIEYLPTARMTTTFC